MQGFGTSTPREPTEKEMMLFQNMNTREMLQLLRNVREPALQRAITARLLSEPSAVASSIAAPDKRKGVNCFMMFRCYYRQLPVFASVPMMHISGALSVLWKQDANQPLWELLSKAYTCIRDHLDETEAKDKNLLKKFMAVIGPALQLPSPASYLEDHGYKAHITCIDEKRFAVVEPILCSPPVQSLVSAGLIDPALSIDDIIHSAQILGFAVNYKFEQSTTSSTFLGYLGQQAIAAEGQEQVQEHATISESDIRAAGKRKRRVKAQTNKKAATVRSLQAHITSAHNMDTGDEAPSNELQFANDEGEQFYDNMAQLMVTNFGQQNPGTLGSAVNTVPEQVENPTINPLPFEWLPFRDGADEDVTLPIYDPTYF